MKDYKFKINGNEYNVVVNDIVENVAKIEVNGTKYDVLLENKEESKVVASKPVQRIVTPVEVANPSNPAGPQIKDIKAPLPGTILDIKVKEGDAIKKGTTVLILEAMKMENDIISNFDGTVSEIKYRNGDSVPEGAVLVEITA